MNIDFNSLSFEDQLRVEQLKTSVKIYATAQGLPIELRFTRAELINTAGVNTLEVDVKIWNTNTNQQVKGGTLTGAVNEASLTSEILVKIHQWIQNNI